ncbi:Thermitase [Lentibacillus sp. JNUCC-1]|uniref:S8 family serine peptidase n=1 Tax=Lentibacillus sp. JNUCC-1 TaxID=2654513 RepID=UPI0012E875DA|nr:S8 family serine peptidase [Lentibacillus sp. JNUCC-1]MUV37015.1 Thermitase [Lentibacillus sp. JNUCC-1]
MDNTFEKQVVEQMGMVYLIKYSEAKYKSTAHAKKALENALKDSGLNVRYVEENETMHALEAVPEQVTPMTVHPEQDWQYNMINASQAWDVTSGSSATKVAVLDTGIDSSHQSLSNFVDTSLGKSFVGGDTADRQGHGTHVAGTIASYGNVSGVMQEATLIPVKVLGDDGKGSMYGIQQGITYAASIDADVVNMSLGGGSYNQGMEEAIITANNQGTIVVAATGNDGVQNVSYPAAYDAAIAVGSVTSSESRSYFSNYGHELDIVAPGSNIYSTTPGGNYDKFSGTSMATPHVAGVLGLMRSADPSVTVSEAKSILNTTAQPAGPQLEYGNGIVDAYAAVQEVVGGGTGGGDNGDGGQEDPQAPAWQSYTWYVAGDVVTYNGKSYVCETSHISFPGYEPPYASYYWSQN